MQPIRVYGPLIACFPKRAFYLPIGGSDASAEENEFDQSIGQNLDFGFC